MLKSFAQPATLTTTAPGTATWLPDSLQTLIQVLSQSRSLTPKQVKQYVLAANISATDLIPWATFSHSAADSYGRQLVCQGRNFEVMVMSWNPGDYSAIHDHGGAQWGAVQCFGTAEHYTYSYNEGTLKTAAPAHYQPGMVREVDHDLIHQMGNAGTVPFLSLHVYGCPEQRQSITEDARIFNLFERAIQYTDGGAFFCLPSDKVNHQSPGLTADVETTLRHHRQMRSRIVRTLATQSSTVLREALTQINQDIAQLLRS